MRRTLFRWAAFLQIGLVLFSVGCHPTQPFFVPRDESLANYLQQSMAIEYADVHVDSLPEVTQAQIPFGPDHIPEDFIELSLEDCISIALQNTKIIRVTNGINGQSGPVSAALLSAAPGQMPSVYDTGILATTGNTQPLTIDNQGNRVAPRGSIRANQVGGVEDALSEFDAQFSALFGYNTTDRPRNVGTGNVFNPQFFQAVDANGQAALSKRLATGTIATARFTTVYSRNNIPSPGFGRSVPSDYTSAIELQITQPLLRGRGTLVNRIPLMLARINEDIQLHDFEANLRNLVRSVEHAYWDLYCGYRALEAAQVSQASALDLWRVAQARTNIGSTPREAEAQAQESYHRFKAQVDAAYYGSPIAGDPLGLLGREQVLREKMGWSATDGRFIRPSDDPTVARVQFDYVSVHAEAITRNAELRRHKWAIKQDELELKIAMNQVLPQLDATLFSRWLGVGDHLASADRTGINFPGAGSNSLEELTGGDYQEYGARLELTPQAFGKRRALANIQNARFQLKKGHEELLEKEMALVQLLQQAWRQVDSTFLSMQSYLNAWQIAEEEISIYNKRIDGDVGELDQSLDNLLRAEERRSRDQLFYYQSVCEYNKAIVNIHYFKGSLLDLNNIALEEGAWVDKAYWDAEERARERASGIYFDYGYTRPGVISNGPVESGGITEGNVSNPGYTYGQQALGDVPSGEPTPAEELDEPESETEDNPSRELEPLPERNRPTAGAMPNSLRSGRSGVVRQAAAERFPNETNAQSAAERFQWGALGIKNSSQPTDRKPSTASNARRSISDSTPNRRPVQVISSGGQHSSPGAPAQWKRR